MRAALYIQVFRDMDKAVELFNELKKKFPETDSAKQVDKVLASIEQSKQRQKEQAEMDAKYAVGKVFPDFNEKDLNGEALSVSRFKGKVVLVDFWATWCGPCISELPNVKDAYAKHRAAGFEIIGISLDQDRNKLKDFIDKHEMPWPQFFDGQGWESKLGRQYGITSIPATFLLDREGRIIGRNLRGPALGAAVAEALAAK
jgi:peroxiredoxin